MSSMIRDLQDPASLPDPTLSVSLVQTHISMVFVADEFVYKIKKPVNFGFLDFSTLEKREFYCNQEVILNRRLSEGIYLDVLPVTLGNEGFRIGGPSREAVEYAIKMRRIPDGKLMSSLFIQGKITDNHLGTVAGALAGFHLNALTSPEIERFGEAERFKVNTDENFDQVEGYIGVSISGDRFREIRKWTDDFYRKEDRIFGRRIESGKIRDCHGDLHMEHICFTEPFAIIDCIEFNERFRYSDTLADIAFLLMDLEYHGGYDLAGELWKQYADPAGEEGQDALLTFYKVYRAFVRGKVNTFQVDDEDIDEDRKDQAIGRAKKYFELAHSYVLSA